MEIARLVLEYLKAFLGTPIVIAITLMVLSRIFKKEIGSIIMRTEEMELPWGAKWKTQGQSVDEMPKELPVVQNPVFPIDNLSPIPEQVKTLTAQLTAENARATIWEYRYLNVFLAPITMEFLQWIAKCNAPITVDLANTIYMKKITNQEHRRNVLTVLMAHDLVAVQNNIIQITPKGKNYLEWRSRV